MNICEERQEPQRVGARTWYAAPLTPTARNTDLTEKFFVSVEVTEEFPFFVTKLSGITTAEPDQPKEMRNEHQEDSRLYRRSVNSPNDRQIPGEYRFRQFRCG